MPKVKTTHPRQTREKGQRSLDLPPYLARWLPQWRRPDWFSAEAWRSTVAQQPIATVCRETLIASLVSLEYKIEPRDSTQRDEYKEDIEYYTDFFENGSDYDYVSIVEWIIGDFLDLPFGAGLEMGWEGDKRPTEGTKNKLLWIELLDGGTLFPTLSEDYPVGQSLKEVFNRIVYFPAHAINRLYMSPRSDIHRKGWGMAPPEKIYLALSLLNRGDYYYANLLLDTPEVGILDLGDMSEESAKTWLEGWRTLLTGIDPFKIPILYEHEKTAEFVSFTRPPTDLMFDKAMIKYSAIVAAGYGMSLSDIGIQVASSGGETLAGSIRQERRTRKTGFARAKNKLKLFFDRMLPPYLEFKFIDLDDELSVALGRARLANATAFTALIDRGVVTPEEARQQIIADGLISISIPEKLPEGALAQLPMQGTPERPGLLGRPIAPSDGGHGEVIPKGELLEVALQSEDFRRAFGQLEDSWEKLDPDNQNTVVSGIQDYLNQFSEDAKLLDTNEMLGDNVEDLE